MSNSSDTPMKKDVPMIVHRQPYVDNNGVHTERVHGPMPVEEWSAYEAEHKL